MASEDHLSASSFVKSVHEKLRVASRKMGVAEAWQQHCTNEDNLKKYALAMHELASQHWGKNLKQNKCGNFCRIDWIHEYCVNYFDTIVFEQYEKEMRICNDKLGITDFEQHFVRDNEEKLRLLDVGSCYNPFKAFDCFDVTAIDIAPANDGVDKCDFLNVQLDEELIINKATMATLPCRYFDVVVFSLFLEYLPCPIQRLECCKKAYNLLRYEGVLCVVTPDSKHVGANAKIMKTWQFLLAKIGFSRIKYEKLPHLHCMAFRKAIHHEIAARWATINDKGRFYDEMVIPQDLKRIGRDQEGGEKEQCDPSLFLELPLF